MGEREEGGREGGRGDRGVVRRGIGIGGRGGDKVDICDCGIQCDLMTCVLTCEDELLT